VPPLKHSVPRTLAHSAAGGFAVKAARICSSAAVAAAMQSPRCAGRRSARVSRCVHVCLPRPLYSSVRQGRRVRAAPAPPSARSTRPAAAPAPSLRPAPWSAARGARTCRGHTRRRRFRARAHPERPAAPAPATRARPRDPCRSKRRETHAGRRRRGVHAAGQPVTQFAGRGPTCSRNPSTSSAPLLAPRAYRDGALRYHHARRNSIC
jgi:hypothetical protein